VKILLMDKTCRCQNLLITELVFVIIQKPVEKSYWVFVIDSCPGNQCDANCQLVIPFLLLSMVIPAPLYGAPLCPGLVPNSCYFKLSS